MGREQQLQLCWTISLRLSQHCPAALRGGLSLLPAGRAGSPVTVGSSREEVVGARWSSLGQMEGIGHGAASKTERGLPGLRGLNGGRQGLLGATDQSSNSGSSTEQHSRRCSRWAGSSRSRWAGKAGTLSRTEGSVLRAARQDTQTPARRAAIVPLPQPNTGSRACRTQPGGSELRASRSGTGTGATRDANTESAGTRTGSRTHPKTPERSKVRPCHRAGRWARAWK